ncbi:beta-ketoacyl synthase [Streptomyces sp. R11]|uniref:3-oxoacyl-[acyl-carrier-protein] synthase 2 n=1 Tax=Streptomyces sp. R11 TaxID=3238625 RepID=A0AB39NEN0_9ACTN
MDDDRRILVTGLGPVTPIGTGAQEFRKAQHDCARGVRTITQFDASTLESRIAGEIDLPADLTLPRRDTVSTDRCTQLLAAAARLAVLDAGLELAGEDPERVGIAVGTGLGGIRSWEEVITTAYCGRGPALISPRSIPKSMANHAAAWLSIHYGITGPATTAVTACASGSEALVTAYQMIASGEVDVVLAGGADAPVTPTSVGGFSRMRTLSQRNEDPPGASRPFSADRDGFVIAEGAGVLILETATHARARDARAYAQFAGYGRTSDAHHVTTPQGDGARRAMRTAMNHARLNPQDVDYINAHGTATRLNDAAEAAAIHAALGVDAKRIAVSSTKSLMGHSMGASGAIEAIASVQAIAEQTAPPTANLDAPDPSMNLDFLPWAAKEMKIRAALSNSFAFGGHNVVLAFTRPSL